jgi:hypothetical protein
MSSGIEPPARQPSARPSWDPAGGRANRTRRVLAPFDALDTPFRIRRALEQSVFAAGFIAASNAFSAAAVLYDHTPPHTLIGSDPRTLAVAQSCAALAAAYLAVRSRRHPGLALAVAILVWSILEAIPFIPAAVYGHGVLNPRYAPLLWLVVGAAVLGVRGALAQRKMAAAATPSA